MNKFTIAGTTSFEFSHDNLNGKQNESKKYRTTISHTKRTEAALSLSGQKHLGAHLTIKLPKLSERLTNMSMYKSEEDTSD